MGHYLRRLASNTDAQFVLQHITSEVERVQKSATGVDEAAYEWPKVREAASLASKRASVSIQDLLAPIVSAGDPASISAAISSGATTLRNLGYYVPTSIIAQHVLTNPNVDTRLLREFRRHATQQQLREISERAVKAMDRELAVTALNMHYGEPDLVHEFYKSAEDPEAFLTWLIGGDETAPDCLLASALVRSDPDLAYRLLPIGNTISRSSTQKKIAEALGDNQEAWDMFTTLANEWSGSVPNLLSTVLSLSDSEK